MALPDLSQTVIVSPRLNPPSAPVIPEESRLLPFCDNAFAAPSSTMIFPDALEKNVSQRFFESICFSETGMNDQAEGPGPEQPGAYLSRPGISLVIAFSDHTPLDSIVAALARQTVGTAVFEAILVDAIHLLDEQTVRRKVEQAAAAGLDIRYERIKRGGRAAANNYGIQRARA